ncbi:MAG: hypothetical protein ACLUD2_16685 [Clostridium sp.]
MIRTLTKENMEGAISHGIRVGVFLYSMALDEGDCATGSPVCAGTDPGI